MNVNALSIHSSINRATIVARRACASVYGVLSAFGEPIHASVSCEVSLILTDSSPIQSLHSFNRPARIRISPEN